MPEEKKYDFKIAVHVEEKKLLGIRLMNNPEDIKDGDTHVLTWPVDPRFTGAFTAADMICELRGWENQIPLSSSF